MRVDFAEEKAKKMIMSDVRRHPTMMSLRGRASFVSRFAKLKAACRTDADLRIQTRTIGNNNTVRSGERTVTLLIHLNHDTIHILLLYFRM